ncbi:MAG: Ig-like domain-containing protein [Gemmatimonadales bacterium]
MRHRSRSSAMAIRLLAWLVPAVAAWAACSNESSIGPGPVASIFLNPTSLTVDVGLQGKIQAVALDQDRAALVGKQLTFVSDNQSIATVDDSGQVTALALGSATVTVSADGISGTVPVSVTLPDIRLIADTLFYSATALGADPAAQGDSIKSLRGGAITGLATGVITYGPGASGWVTAATLGGTTVPTNITVQVATGALAPGNYDATVPITSPDAAAGKNLTLVFTVSPPGPRIGLSPSSLTFGAQVGGANPASKTVSVTNAGGGTLDQLLVGTITYGAGASGWITNASLDVLTAPATLTVQPATGSLASGTYTATIPITSPVATNTPQDVTVTFAVTAISFASDVQPIFTASCIGCHFTGGLAPNLTFGNAYTAIVNVTSTTVLCGGQIYVVPGSPSTSFLQQKMDSTHNCGGRMPPGVGQMLPQATRDIIRLWILSGAPNN